MNEKEKVNLRIRIESGKVYVSLNYGQSFVNRWRDLTPDMRIVLDVLCQMDDYDVVIDAQREV